MKKVLSLILILTNLLLVSGCASIYDKDYVFVDDYKTSSKSSSFDRKPTVSNLTELKNAILEIVKSGKSESSILFSEKYDGDIDEDLSNSCWQIKSQDALCVYCVDNISYELSRLVTYYEAVINVDYSDTAAPQSEVHKLKYSTGFEDLIYTAIKNHDEQLVILVERSTYSSTDIENLINDTYCSDPIISPVKPDSSVSTYPGKNYQRLYDIKLTYGIDSDELVSRQTALDDLTLFTEEEINKSDYEKLLAVFSLMSDITPGYNSSIYDALILRESNSEGISLAFVALCNAIGLDSVFVTGLKDWNNYSWNMVRIDGILYHIDMSIRTDEPMLLSDEQMWNQYRWDTSKYPSCESVYNNSLENN